MPVTTLSTLTITVDTPRTVAQLQHLLRDTTNPREELRNIVNYFKALASGVESADFTVQTSASPMVRASATLTGTFGSMANNDTVTLAGTVLTGVTGTPSGAQYKILTNATITSTNLAALINANTTTNKLFSATSAAGVVTVTSLTPGLIGNQLTIASSSAGYVASGANLASGTGGSETAPVTYNKGR